MKSFLQHIVDDIPEDKLGELKDWCYIFPSKRAGLYFENLLTIKFHGNTYFSPSIFGIEDFVNICSGHKPGDEITLVFLLYKVYREKQPNLEFEKFYLINVYVPNSGSGMKRLDYRKIWDSDFLNFCLELNKKKPVIIGGDFNVAHQEIDLARPKENYNKTSGYTQVEIDGMDGFVKAGFSDSYRLKHPEQIMYTFWNMRFGARARNVGWRIDYFMVGLDLKDKIVSADIHNDVMGSDHCPLSLELDI